MNADITPRWLSWRPTGVVLALDDVLVESTTCRTATWGWWAKRRGLDPELLVEAAWGRATADVVREFVPSSEVEAAVDAIVARERILLRTVRRSRGAWNFVQAIPPGRLAVLSSGTSEQTAERWRRARFAEPQLLLTADDVASGPPHPDAHLAAAEAMGMPPETCIAIEGSPAGVAAAAAAGMTTLMVLPGIERVRPPAASAVIHRLSVLRVELVTDGVELTLRNEPTRGW